MKNRRRGNSGLLCCWGDKYMVPASEVAIVLQRNNITVKVNTIFINNPMAGGDMNIGMVFK